jgi:hypothetical protein
MTVQLKTEIEAAGTPTRVWEILTDFSAYPSWIPFLEIEGRASVGEPLKYVFFRDAKPERRRYAIPAVVHVCRPPAELGWIGGAPLLLRIRERFVLRASTTGTLIEHTAKYSGLVVLFVGRARVISRVKPFMESMNRALARKVALSSGRGKLRRGRGRL